MRLGYACINLSLPTRLKTVRMRNATPERVLELARHNLAECVRAAEWNAAHGMGLLRLTSDLVPFGSHPEVASDWREEMKEDFAKAGEALRAAGQRISTHPGQYTVLNSPRPEVVGAAVLELCYQADMLDLMGMKAEMVLHLGGAYGDRDAAADRFEAAFRDLPKNARNRLVIENDDVTWNAGAALAMGRRIGRPVVFDVYHDTLLPTEGLSAHDALKAALATWPADRAPKIHYSDPAPGKRRGMHGDLVDPEGFRAFLVPAKGARGFDVMVEAKMKDLAVVPLLPIAKGARRLDAARKARA